MHNMAALNIMYNVGALNIIRNMGALNIIHKMRALTMHKMGALTFTFFHEHGMAVKLMLTTTEAEFYWLPHDLLLKSHEP